MSDTHAAIDAQAYIHHQYLLGLELMVATTKGAEVVGDWMFRLFRRQHEEKFLSSFDKLGLAGLPDAVACARYHVLSNSMGGVAVEYMEESDRKAWVRFRYPRWMYDGAAICGIPVEASRGFLRGWYGQNGVSLKNPRLGYVCVSEDMTGEFGLCGYFREYDHDLADDERLQFARDETPPPFDPAQQPAPPVGDWSAERLAKANRNYAMEYIRNGMAALEAVIGREETLAIAGRAARLTGLQTYQHMRGLVGAIDGDAADGVRFLADVLSGMGDHCTVAAGNDGSMTVHQQGLRILRGLDAAEAATLLAAWTELWAGALQSHRIRKTVETVRDGDTLVWTVRDIA
jgi:hypothetical protein